jgi:hypothetical protein
MESRTRTEIPGAMPQAEAGMSHHGLRIRKLQMVLQVQEIAIATVIDFPIAREDGEIRSAMIGEIGETEAVAIEIVVTEDGTEIEINGKSASRSGWMSRPKIKAKPIPKKTFRSGESNSIKRTKLERRLSRIYPNQMQAPPSLALTRRLKLLWKSSKQDPTNS